MQRVKIYLEDRGDVAFIGKELYWSGERPEIAAYLTKRHRIAVYDPDAQRLYEFDSFSDLIADDVWELVHPRMVSAVAEALGEKHVIELDI